MVPSADIVAVAYRGSRVEVEVEVEVEGGHARRADRREDAGEKERGPERVWRARREAKGRKGEARRGEEEKERKGKQRGIDDADEAEAGEGR